MADLLGDADRYDGRPLVKLLDAWVLDAIGFLDEGTAGQLLTQAHRLGAALDAPAPTWQGVITRRLAMPPGAADAVRRLWGSLQEDAILAGSDGPDPLAFARELVDARFAAAAR